jgi:hypothetical protein
VDRLTASATYHRVLRPSSIWASTVGWGRDREPGRDATNAFLAETSVTLDERDAWYGRLEISEKTGHDLAIESPDVFTVGRISAGYTRYFGSWHGFKPGAGAALSAGIAPGSLEPVYGSRVNFGFAVYLTIRPGEAGSHAQ